MKRLLPLLIALVAASCTSTGTVRAPEVLRVYDSVEGVTIWTHTPVMLKNIGFDGSPAVLYQLAAICQGSDSEPCGDPFYLLAFSVQGQHLTASSDMTLRIGEKRLRPDHLSYEADTRGLTRFQEALVFPIERGDAAAFAAAPDGQVEGRIGGVTVQFSETRREASRMLMDRME